MDLKVTCKLTLFFPQVFINRSNFLGPVNEWDHSKLDRVLNTKDNRWPTRFTGKKNQINGSIEKEGKNPRY